MSKKIILIFLILGVGIFFTAKFASKENGILKSPEDSRHKSLPTATSTPTPAYNPPQEVKFNSTTNLKQELDSINPQILDSDFQGS